LRATVEQIVRQTCRNLTDYIDIDQCSSGTHPPPDSSGAKGDLFREAVGYFVLIKKNLGQSPAQFLVHSGKFKPLLIFFPAFHQPNVSSSLGYRYLSNS